jgi:hypothetical protein
MAQELYSESLSDYSDHINNEELLESIQHLMDFLGVQEIKLLNWADKYVAIPLTVPVELPPLGNFQDIDIKSEEPILLVIHTERYPSIPPAVHTDRLSFPKDHLAHLYVVKNGQPPEFCLVRGSRADWYANKRLKDLYIRVCNWLRDASAGELTEDGNQFDPLRLEGYSGMMIYDYDELFQIVTEKKSFLSNENFAIGMFERISYDDNVTFKIRRIVTRENLEDSKVEFEKELQKDDSIPSKKKYHFGYILWSDTEEHFNNYCVELPSDLNSFRVFCRTYGINFSRLEHFIATVTINLYIAFPVIVGIKRPKKLIGFSGSIEFINFLFHIDSADKKDGIIINNKPVKFYKHGQPLKRSKAKEISGIIPNIGEYSLVVGCGALGSKVVMHFSRCGITNLLLTDPDDVSPHNLVRHALLGNSEGKSKAHALKQEIINLYPYDKHLTFSSGLSGGYWLSPEMLKLYNWIFDFSASYSFLHQLIKANLSTETRVARAFISDSGNLGVLFFEGKHRNPRLDDLQVMLYGESRNNNTVCGWLQREANEESSAVSVTVGVGCNSETTVLSDDIVSLHGAYISNVIKFESYNVPEQQGVIYLNEIVSEPFFHNVVHRIEVPAMIVLTAKNDPSWQMRFKPGILETMQEEMKLALPHETGGVMVGSANFKTKTIHVVELIKAPPDSKANPVCFFRGVDGLPESIEKVNELTGNQLGYIGEWHTHPEGPEEMSTTDLRTVIKFKKEFDNLTAPLPVFLMIITPDNILPFVF